MKERVHCLTFCTSQESRKFLSRPWVQLGNTCSVYVNITNSIVTSKERLCFLRIRDVLNTDSFPVGRLFCPAATEQSAGKSSPAGQQTSCGVLLFQEWHSHYFTWFTKKTFQSSSTSVYVIYFKQDITSSKAAPRWAAEMCFRGFFHHDWHMSSQLRPLHWRTRREMTPLTESDVLWESYKFILNVRIKRAAVLCGKWL